ncbi:hypothetical protein OG21DRAFT_1509291 [Imleria badia]|nr:hypothetical protein OG21DRAFT_1509291 [Imleria badia]
MGFPIRSAVLAALGELQGRDGHHTGHKMRLRANGATDDEVSFRMSLLSSRPEEEVVGGSKKWHVGRSESLAESCSCCSGYQQNFRWL